MLDAYKTPTSMTNADLMPIPTTRRRNHEDRNKDQESDASSYFLARRRTADSDAVSPKDSPSGELSVQKTRSQKSGASTKGPRPRGLSISDSQSVMSRNQHIRDWNESRMGLNSPSSIGCRSTQPLDPPRPARDGLEWVWFPDGYWAEREVRALSPSFTSTKFGSRPRWWNRSPERRSKGSEKSGKIEITKTAPSAPIDLPRIKIGSIISRKNSRNSKTSRATTDEQSPLMTRKSSRNAPHGGKRNGLLAVGDQKPFPPYYAVAPAEQLGLYCRTKKTIQTKILQRAAVVSYPGAAKL